jgi:hypothetical protein
MSSMQWLLSFNPVPSVGGYLTRVATGGYLTRVVIRLVLRVLRAR